MDLLDKAKKIAMTNLLILQNPMPLAICAPPPTTNPKQKRLGVKEKLHEADTSILIKRKKNRKKHY
jgi:hypothetical protein